MKNDWDLTKEKIEKHLEIYHNVKLPELEFTHYMYRFYYMISFTINGIKGGMFIKEDEYFSDKMATLNRISDYIVSKMNEREVVKL